MKSSKILAELNKDEDAERATKLGRHILMFSKKKAEELGCTPADILYAFIELMMNGFTAHQCKPEDVKTVLYELVEQYKEKYEEYGV